MSGAKTKSGSNEIYKEIGGKLRAVTKQPEEFLRAQPEKSDSIRELMQKVYLIATGSDTTNRRSLVVLPELMVEAMDEEMIWQQLELRNNVVLPQLLQQSSKLLALREDKLEIRLNEGESINESDEEQGQEDEANGLGAAVSDDNEEALRGFEDEEMGDEEEDEEEQSCRLPERRTKVRSSEVDDKFFKLGEMEAFLEAEDAKELRKQKGKPAAADNDGLNYFADDFGSDDNDEAEEEDEETRNPNYRDFFDVDEEEERQNRSNEKKKIGKTQNNLFADAEDQDDEDHEQENEEGTDKEMYEEAEDDKNDKIQLEKTAAQLSDKTPASDSDSDSTQEDEEERPKSSFELRQERLEQRIRDYEDEVLGEKPWQLKGEIQASSRPQNSLLEEILEFESTTRPAPVITEQTTQRLEDIIRQRIKDQAWDDVQAKVRPVQTPQDYRKLLVLDQEKSKQSLAQIYEKEYQSELAKLDPNRGADAADEVPKEHMEIKRLMRALFVKLDALSNFHFSPKPVAPEPKIITNTPAVVMEEVAPVAVSNAKLLAPEELYRGPKHELLGKSERTRTDKNRERRQKKQKQSAIHKALEVKNVRRQQAGIPLTKKEEGVKLLKSITKHRNVEKITASKDQGSLKSSKAFFSKLQDATSTSAGGTNARAAKKKTDAKSFSAKKLKL